MARSLGRWRSTDTPPIGASPGAFLTSPLDDRARQIAARRITPPKPKPKIVDHIYVVADEPRPKRRVTHDSLPAARPRGRDQLEQPQLMCRIGQHGTTGEWSAEDGDGNALRVENGKAGLEIWRDPPEDGQGGGENLAGSAPPGATSLDRLRRRIGPRQAVGDKAQQEFTMRATQQYLDELWRPK